MNTSEIHNAIAGVVRSIQGDLATIEFSFGGKMTWPVSRLKSQFKFQDTESLLGRTFWIYLSNEEEMEKEHEQIAKAVLNEILKTS